MKTLYAYPEGYRPFFCQGEPIAYTPRSVPGMAMKTAIRQAQGEVCPWCPRDFAFGSATHPLAPTFDHVFPVALGGGDWRFNCLIGHRECNERKGDRLPYPCELIWLAAVNDRIAPLMGRAA